MPNKCYVGDKGANSYRTMGHMLQDPRRMPATADSTEPIDTMIFFCTYRPMIKFNL